MASIKTNNPGKYGYRHKSCGHIAFAIVGDEYPASSQMDDLEIAQQGKHISKNSSFPICQHCGLAVSLAGDLLDGQQIVDIDEYCYAMTAQNKHGLHVTRETECVVAKAEPAPEPKPKAKVKKKAKSSVSGK